MPETDREDSQLSSPSKGKSGALQILLRVLIPVVILSVGTYAYLQLAKPKEEAKTPPAEKKALRTRIKKLRVQDYQVVITTDGMIQPHNEVALSSEVSGRVVSISPSFEAGSFFKADEVIVQLDANDYETAVDIATAQKLSAESALKLAELNHQRQIRLFNKNVATEAEVTQAAATETQAKAQLDSAKAQLERAERDLDRTKIIAPFDGRVRNKLVGVGQSISAGTPLGTAFAVDFAEVRLPISALELQYLDLPELATDEPVDVTLRDAINPDNKTEWQAKIVRTEGTLDQNSLELFAIARIEDPFGRNSGSPPLRVGQPVAASIAGKMLKEVVALPRSAVRQLDQIHLVDSELSLVGKTINPIWRDKDNVIVRDPEIADGEMLATTRMVYPPEGAKVEIIPDTDVELTESKPETKTANKPVNN